MTSAVAGGGGDAALPGDRELATMLALVPIAAFVLDGRSGALLQANWSLDQVLGAAGDGPGRAVLPIDPTDLAVLVEEVSQAGSVKDFEVRLRRPDRRLAWGSITAALSHHGGRDRIVGVMADVTARKVRLAAMTETEQRFRAIVDSVADGVITMRADGVITSFSPAATAIFGWQAGEVVGQDVDVLVPEDAGPHQAHVRRYVETGTSAIIGRGPREVVAQRRDGSPVPVEITIARMPVGASAQFVAVVRDVTRRKELEAARDVAMRQLDRAQRLAALGTLAGGLAHELNNALVPVMGMAELWLATLPAEAPERRRVETIFRASERAAGLVAQLLEFSRAEAPRFVRADLRAIVDQQVGLLRSANAAGVPLTWAPPADPLGAEVDEDQVCRLIAHLVSNAADAIRAKGSGAIEVSLATAEVDESEAVGLGLKRAGSFARVAVRDSGCGMDATTLARAFDPFFTTKSVGKGTGLGLSVVQGVVAAHQGGIAIRSAPGEGTDVRVFLPLTGNVVPAEASAPAG